MAVDFVPAVYNTLDVLLALLAVPGLLNNSTEDGAVIRCPECSAEIDVDEDEVEEGEILSCPECECELEVSQIHPVHLNVISEDSDDDDDDDDEEDEKAENGDAPEDEEEEEEEDVE
jgi:alpha-aminoadipate/glutamate carrier protein LysW